MTAAATQAWNPVLYDDKAAFVSNLASDLVLLLAPKSGERVLDIGCGTGTLSAEIANAGARVTGLDASSAMIDAAREKYPELERAGLEPREMRWFERPTPLAGEHGLSAWMTLFQEPLLNHLGARQARFLELLAERCRPQLYRDQTWFVDYTRLRVLATKPR